MDVLGRWTLAVPAPYAALVPAPLTGARAEAVRETVLLDAGIARFAGVLAVLIVEGGASRGLLTVPSLGVMGRIGVLMDAPRFEADEAPNGPRRTLPGTLIGVGGG